MATTYIQYGPINIPKHCSEAVGAENYMPVTGNGYMQYITTSGYLKFGIVQSPKLCKQLKKLGRVYNVKVRKYFLGVLFSRKEIHCFAVVISVWSKH